MLGRIYFTDNQVNYSLSLFLVFVLRLSSLTLDKNKKSTNWLLTRISSEIKPFDTDLEPTMFNLANGRVTLKLLTLF